MSPTLLSVTSCADDVSDNGVALEEEEEDAKELDDNGLRLHPVQHRHPGTNQMLITRLGHTYIYAYKSV